jgi:WD40 repeat protein
MNSIHLRIAINVFLIALSSSLALAQRTTGEGDFKLEVRHRVNAHGDEFNALAKSSDGRRIFTGTEKGDIIVWNVVTNRREQTLHQPSGIHHVVALSDPRELVAASSNHVKPQNALVRKWNVETGTFVDLSGIEADCYVTGLATNASGLIVATTNTQNVIVWDSRTNEPVAQWKIKSIPTAVALIGRNVYVATIAQNDENPMASEGAIARFNLDDQDHVPTDVVRVSRRLWVSLQAAPGGRLLSGTYQEGYGDAKTVLIDPVSRSERAPINATATLWLGASRLMLFNWLDPIEVVQISGNARTRSIRKFERFESDTPGRPFDLTGQVSNAAGSKVWASYSKGPGLLELNLTTKKIKTLIGGPSGAYGVSVATEDGQTGELLTGGADGYVRLWNLADVSLTKEYKVAKQGYYVSEVHLVPGSRRAIVDVGKIPTRFENPGPGEIYVLDLVSGEQRKLFDLLMWRSRTAVVDGKIVYPEGDRIKLRNIEGSENARELPVSGLIESIAISANKRWLAVFHEPRQLTVFDLQSDQKKSMSVTPEEYAGLVITDDGQHVYNIASEGELTHWNVSAGTSEKTVLARIREMHTRVDFMTLANDDRWLVTAGNHHDVAIFERATGRLVFFVQAAAAAFYIEKVWLNNKRMIFTTDIGVMYEGMFQ